MAPLSRESAALRFLVFSVLVAHSALAQIDRAWKNAIESHDTPSNLYTQCQPSTVGFLVKEDARSTVYYIRILDKQNTAEYAETLKAEGCGYEITRDANGLHFVAPNGGCRVYIDNDKRVMNVEVEKVVRGQKQRALRFAIECPISLRSIGGQNQELPWQAPPSPSCDASTRRIPCGSGSQIPSDASCRERRCCYDAAQQTCFYGNPVCTTDGRFVIPVPRDITSPALNLSTLRLGLDLPECRPVVASDEYVVFDFPLASCGTSSQWDGEDLIYEVMLIADRELCTDGDVSITRSSTYELLLQCRFPGMSDVEMIGVEVNTLPPQPPATAEGPLFIEIRVATDGDYLDYYSQFPVVKFLRDPIFLEVRLLDHPDPSLVLVLQDCWATPTPDPLNSVQWRVLDNHCPFTDDNYLTVLHPMAEFPSTPLGTHYKRFEVKTFVFMTPGGTVLPNGQLYFHCSAYVCQGDDVSCVPPCPVSRFKRTPADAESLSLVTVQGPVIILVPEENEEWGFLSSDVMDGDDAIKVMVLTLSGVSLLVALIITLVIAVFCRRQQQRVVDKASPEFVALGS
ncbi:LOW QUALITY PROTEIN: zona pellucida sperm-binding protein 4-like [Lethenteron reissneri]|uniref:LOW QUALITY PROTEIN: zona pellucida sperm-binding protein 4-like n=1 Tax=Lethenteron reissneri TaxID=7753 RepID=UPI002AB794F0|nr:LOW QUALITY PROTEIN: zona pellucida sperm-binding protein 4-like [Lethenteron reissneri]